MIVYIAGPMSGLPEHNFPLFEHVASRFRLAGHDVVSPVEIGYKVFNNDTKNHTVHEFLIEDIKELLHCNAICLLPGWEKSCGALCEAALAKALGFVAFDEFGATITIGDLHITKTYGPR